MVVTETSPMRRIATFGFAPPRQLNFPLGVSYTDIDRETGEHSYVPVARAPSVSKENALFIALERLSLIELAHRLDVDWNNPPEWVPKLDQALDANLRVTEAELHDRLIADLLEDEMPTSHEAPQFATLNKMAFAPRSFHVPRHFTSVGIALEQADFSDESSAPGEVADKMVESMRGLKRVFDAESEAADLSELRLSTSFGHQADDVRPIGEIDDLGVATFIAWTANLTTSMDPLCQQPLALWLSDQGGNALSRKVSLQIERSSEKVQFDLALSASLGRVELRRMNDALGRLAQHWSIESGF